MHFARNFLTLAILLASAGAAPAQPQLVIVTESTKQYHRPSCPLVRDGKREDAIAMTMGQAEARGYKSHPACDPANASAVTMQSGPRGSSQNARQSSVFVYTTVGDPRYHRETCAKVPKERKKVLLEEAGKKLWPCSECRPPIRKRTPAVPKRYGRE